MAGDFNLVALLVALLGSAGLGGVVTSVVNSIVMAKQGISGREDKRRDDIIRQRDEAVARARQAEADADAADLRADRERINRIRLMEHAARLRLQLIKAGIEPAAEPPMKE